MVRIVKDDCLYSEIITSLKRLEVLAIKIPIFGYTQGGKISTKVEAEH
jgi:hypothetical protein